MVVWGGMKMSNSEIAPYVEKEAYIESLVIYKKIYVSSSTCRTDLIQSALESPMSQLSNARFLTF